MEHTPKNVVLQLGSLITMYISASFMTALLFGIITIIYPADTDTYWEIEQATDTVQLSIAMLIIFFPTFILLTRMVQKTRRSESGTSHQTLTKWLIYLSLLVAGLIMLGTLVTVLYTFLNGELTERFLLKSASLLGVIGVAFHYYVLDAKNHWAAHEDKSIMFGIGVSIVVATTVAFGFRHIETPAEVREMKLDETQVSDLQNIQWQLASYLETSSSTLPATLTDAYQGAEVPAAPTGREAYSYEITDTGFKLCATFSRNHTNEFTGNFFDPAARIKNAENWNYQAGRYCFERVVK